MLKQNVQLKCIKGFTTIHHNKQSCHWHCSYTCANSVAQVVDGFAVTSAMSHLSWSQFFKNCYGFFIITDCTQILPDAKKVASCDTEIRWGLVVHDRICHSPFVKGTWVELNFLLSLPQKTADSTFSIHRNHCFSADAGCGINYIMSIGLLYCFATSLS